MKTPFKIIMDQSVNYASDSQIILQLSGMKQDAENLSKINLLLQDSKGLKQLSRYSVRQIRKFGLTNRQSVSIVASFELVRRYNQEDALEKVQIRSSKDAYDILAPKIMNLPHEEFWVAYLNRANKVMFTKQISSGGVAGTVVDNKIIFKYALESLASGIVLCHNHPSGNLYPSNADNKITGQIKEAGKLLDVNVLDHLIITSESYYSYADEGKL